jgi:hypothetical protein
MKILVFFSSSERTAEKLRYLRLSTTTRKGRSKRTGHASSPHLLQSPVLSEARSSTSSITNTTGKEKINANCMIWK